MSGKNRITGSKIVDNGWIDFEGSPRFIKPFLNIDSGCETTLNSSPLKEKLRNFIDVNENYFFQGVKINPEMNEILSKYKYHQDKITHFRKWDDSEHQLRMNTRIVNSYVDLLRSELNNANIPHIVYNLATIDNQAYVQGILSWPTVFIGRQENHSFLVDKVNSSHIYNNAQTKWHENKDLRKSITNIQPLILDNDTILEVKGDLVQKMANLLLTYIAKYTLPNHNSDDL
jgi:hypothetical protein